MLQLGARIKRKPPFNHIMQHPHHMRSNPFTQAKEKKPYVEAFLAEISTGKPEPYSIVPARFLCHLFNLWIDHRRAGETLKMNQQRFTYVVGLLGYTVSRKTRTAITCVNVALLPESAPPREHVATSLGAENMEPFNPPKLADLPSQITNELIAVRHTLELMVRNGKMRAEMWGNDGRLSAGEYLAKPYEPSASEAVDPKPSEVQADAALEESPTGNNDYDA